MPIKDALQLAYRLAQYAPGLKPRPVHIGHGSDQILGRAHLMDSLRREQADVRGPLGLENPAELRRGLAADVLQFPFGQSLVG